MHSHGIAIKDICCFHASLFAFFLLTSLTILPLTSPHQPALPIPLPSPFQVGFGLAQKPILRSKKKLPPSKERKEGRTRQKTEEAAEEEEDLTVEQKAEKKQAESEGSRSSKQAGGGGGSAILKSMPACPAFPSPTWVGPTLTVHLSCLSSQWCGKEDRLCHANSSL